MKMYFDPKSRHVFTFSELRRVIRMLSADELPDSLIHFIEGLIEIEVSDHES